MSEKLKEYEEQIAQLKGEKENCMLVCKNHPNKEIYLYCYKRKEFMCIYCAFEKQATPLTSIQSKSQDIVSHSQELIKKLNKTLEDIQAIF